MTPTHEGMAQAECETNVLPLSQSDTVTLNMTYVNFISLIELSLL